MLVFKGAYWAGDSRLLCAKVSIIGTSSLFQEVPTVQLTNFSSRIVHYIAMEVLRNKDNRFLQYRVSAFFFCLSFNLVLYGE